MLSCAITLKEIVNFTNLASRPLQVDGINVNAVFFIEKGFIYAPVKFDHSISIKY